MLSLHIASALPTKSVRFPIPSIWGCLLTKRVPELLTPTTTFWLLTKLLLGTLSALTCVNLRAFPLQSGFHSQLYTLSVSLLWGVGVGGVLMGSDHHQHIIFFFPLCSPLTGSFQFIQEAWWSVLVIRICLQEVGEEEMNASRQLGIIPKPLTPEAISTPGCSVKGRQAATAQPACLLPPA